MISVVIPTYRKSELLSRTLDALCEQEVAGGFEVIVIDDGSGDGTPELVRGFAGRVHLELIVSEVNEGRARARNHGWRAARGDSVLFLDDDIVLDEGAIAAHAAAQERQPAAYIGPVVSAPELGRNALYDYLDTRGIAKLPIGSAVPARYFLTQNASLPRRALAHVAGFDESFGTYGFEDTELAFRVERTLGIPFLSLGGARGVHVHDRTLAQYLEGKRLCGRETLPRLAEVHPERLREMQLDLVVPGAPMGIVRRAWAGALKMSFRCGLPDLLERTVGGEALGTWPAIRSRSLDYLVIANYWRGLAARHDGTRSA